MNRAIKVKEVSKAGYPYPPHIEWTFSSINCEPNPDLKWIVIYHEEHRTYYAARHIRQSCMRQTHIYAFRCIDCHDWKCEISEQQLVEAGIDVEPIKKEMEDDLIT